MQSCVGIFSVKWQMLLAKKLGKAANFSCQRSLRQSLERSTIVLLKRAIFIKKRIDEQTWLAFKRHFSQKNGVAIVKRHWRYMHACGIAMHIQTGLRYQMEFCLGQN